MNKKQVREWTKRNIARGAIVEKTNKIGASNHLLDGYRRFELVGSDATLVIDDTHMIVRTEKGVIHLPIRAVSHIATYYSREVFHGVQPYQVYNFYVQYYYGKHVFACGIEFETTNFYEKEV